MRSRFGVVVVAAGKSERFINGTLASPSALQKKPFVPLAGRAIWVHSAEKFTSRDDVVQFLLVVSPEDRKLLARVFADEIARYHVELVDGGAERFLSVANALASLSAEVDYVAVHDAARPCVTDEEISAVFAKAVETKAAILATRASSSFKRSRSEGGLEVIDAAISRANLWEAATPQVFERKIIERAYRERGASAAPTDDAELVTALGVSVALVEGSRTNVKITRPEDLSLAEFLLERATQKKSKEK